jgi:hypothetical protein
MKSVLNKITQFYSTTNREVRWWAYAAWTAPFTALAGIFFLDQIGWSDGISRLVVIGGVIFFTAAVYWWWWAIFKLARISNLLLETAENLKKIGKEMRAVGKEIADDDK